MKNLVDILNEGLVNETHYLPSAPKNITELKRDQADFTRDIKDSQKKQKEYEQNLENANKDAEKFPDKVRLINDMINRSKYMIAREKAEQAYAQMMIDSIDEILKEMK